MELIDKIMNSFRENVPHPSGVEITEKCPICEGLRNILEKYLPKEEVAEEGITNYSTFCPKHGGFLAEECPRCKKHRQDAVEDAKKWVEKVNLEYNLKSEPKKIEPLKFENVYGDNPIQDKINEIINFINNN